MKTRSPARISLANAKILILAALKEYNEVMEADGEPDEIGSAKDRKIIREAVDMEDIIRTLDNIGLNGEQAYDFVFACLIKNR